MNTRLEECGLRFTTVQCAEAECEVEFDVDARHRDWPDGPYYCPKHDPARKEKRRGPEFKVRVP